MRTHMIKIVLNYKCLVVLLKKAVEEIGYISLYISVCVSVSFGCSCLLMFYGVVIPCKYAQLISSVN